MPLPLAPILTALTVYAAGRILTALGFGFLVYTGITELQDQFYNAINGNIGGLPSSILKIATLYGFIEYAKIVLGAISMRLALKSLKILSPL